MPSLPVVSTFALTGSKKEEMLASLAVLVIADAGGEMTAEVLTAVVEASGNKISPTWATLFATTVAKAEGVSKFCPAPGSGGGDGGAAAPAGASAAAVVEVVEEEEVDMGGSMDMFGGGEAGGGDY